MQKLEQLKESPSQTAGPYVHIGLMPNFLGIEGIYPTDLGVSPISEGAKGAHVTITGRVIDGAGMILRDAMIESWQADAEGRYNGDPAVNGWCRFAADFDTGIWTLKTIKPGSVPAPNGKPMAPHINLWLVARGINLALQTRLHFDDEDNDSCPILARIEQRERVQTLIAKSTGPNTYHLDIILQGEGETVFFDL